MKPLGSLLEAGHHVLPVLECSLPHQGGAIGEKFAQPGHVVRDDKTPFTVTRFTRRARQFGPDRASRGRCTRR